MDDAWLATVRVARDCGDVSSLYPRGITRLFDLPYTLHNNIRLALHFLSFDELTEKERPPKKIWLDVERMKMWWSEVKAAREDEAKGGNSVMDMPQNALLKDIFRGRSPSG